MKTKAPIQRFVILVPPSWEKNLCRFWRADLREASPALSRSAQSVWSLRLGPAVAGLMLGVLSLNFSAAAADPPLPDKISFNRDIRPIFSSICFKCHGPDENKRKAKLRLDLKEDALLPHKNGTPLVPGKPNQSEVYQRITSKDPDELMPPAKSGMKLTGRQIKLIKQWIEQGGEIQPFWAFVAPTTPPVPIIQKTGIRIQNPIDAFIVDRLTKEKLKQSPEADRTILIRRVSLDLTGIPPMPDEVDAFLADQSANAYEKVVDRLLASPRYGERMAMNWLDGARYSDSNGYQADWQRFQWPWRDWVIQAFNRNLPFDQFTIEQLAGDMLPNATLDQRIATGFNRNHRINGEGGSIDEEWRTEYVIDRIETTSAVWLGLTMGCARCHDHKYDPITQKDFYQFFAFFNNIPEQGVVPARGVNHPPLVKIPTPEYQKQVDELTGAVSQQEKKFNRLKSTLDTAQAAWEKTIASTPTPPLDNGLLARFTLDRNSKQGEFKDGRPVYKSGVLGDAVEFDGKRFIDLGDTANFDRTDAFSFGAWIYPTNEGNTGAFIARIDDSKNLAGYNLIYDKGSILFQFISVWPENALLATSKGKIALKEWSHVFVTYDGSGKAAGAKLYINGKPAAVANNKDNLSGTTRTIVPLQLASRGGDSMKFIGRMDDVRFYSRSLAHKEVSALVTTDLAMMAKTSASSRSKLQEEVLSKFFLADHAPIGFQEAQKKLDGLRKQLTETKDKIPSVMVMEEMSKPRDAFILIRGQYDKKGDKVTAATPAALPPMPQGAPVNRLGLAQWIASPNNPLTARVQVNRYWERFFGTGLCKTTENLGSQSEWPSHPELLDWMATEFVRLKWDMKAMQKEIVMSATYRQSSRLTPDSIAKDPENRLLAHGPRFRLQAEMIRDNALAISGLLTEKLGGPSVYPYQPSGIWDEVNFYGNMHNYKNATDGSEYRRSLYTIWKRTTPPPSMMLFDMPSREVCVVKRTLTNTPLQALTLLNETTYVEAARVLAERMLQEGGSTPDQRFIYAFRRAVSRPPTPAELKILASGFQKHLAQYRKDTEAAKKLIHIGESKPNDKFDVAELAAYTMLASVILNLDETLTKE